MIGLHWNWSLGSTALACLVAAAACGSTKGDDSSESGAGHTDTDPGAPTYPDCVEPAGASAQFTVTIDGTNDVLATWAVTPGADIDGPCDVVSQDAAAGTLSLACVDLEGTMRTVDLAYESSPAVGLVLAEGPVDFFFNRIHASDELEAERPTEATSFMLGQGGAVLLAGVDGEYSQYEGEALPTSVTWSTESGLCDFSELDACSGTERRRGTFEVAGSSAELFDGDSAMLGAGLLVVAGRLEGSRINPTADDMPGDDPCCCHGPPTFVNARFLIGAPL